jgi:hypothetical protein
MKWSIGNGGSVVLVMVVVVVVLLVVVVVLVLVVEDVVVVVPPLDSDQVPLPDTRLMRRYAVSVTLGVKLIVSSASSPAFVLDVGVRPGSERSDATEQLITDGTPRRQGATC